MNQANVSYNESVGEVIEHRLRDITEVSKNQFGFIPGRSTMETIYLLRRVIEKYREKKRDISYGVY